METKVQKWGNSLAVRLSRHVVDEAQLHEGSLMSLEAKKGKIVLRMVTKKVYTLRMLLAGVKRKNIHAEVEFGKPVGKETW
jgi:antitoxin MazE